MDKETQTSSPDLVEALQRENRKLKESLDDSKKDIECLETLLTSYRTKEAAHTAVNCVLDNMLTNVVASQEVGNTNTVNQEVTTSSRKSQELRGPLKVRALRNTLNYD